MQRQHPCFWLLLVTSTCLVPIAASSSQPWNAAGGLEEPSAQRDITQYHPQYILVDILVDDVLAGHPLHDRWLLMARRALELALPPDAQCPPSPAGSARGDSSSSNSSVVEQSPSFHVAAFRPDLVRAAADEAKERGESGGEDEGKFLWIILDFRSVNFASADCVEVPRGAAWKNGTLIYYITGALEVPFCKGKGKKGSRRADTKS